MSEHKNGMCANAPCEVNDDVPELGNLGQIIQAIMDSFYPYEAVLRDITLNAAESKHDTN